MAAQRQHFAVSFRPSSEIRKRLRLGTIVRAVVVQPLAKGTAMISVRGLNTVSVSPLPLMRGQVLYAEVTDIGEKVHLRIVPSPKVREASRATTAAELARHLAGLGIEPTEAAICLAAAMLSAELPITAEDFATVSRLVHEAGRDDEATAAAAAYTVRHGLADDAEAIAAVRVALFEPPCLGELLVALEAALSSANPAPSGRESIASAVRSLLRRLRSGGPGEWLSCAAELYAAPAQPEAESPCDWPALLAQCAPGGEGDLAEIATRLRAVLAGLRAAHEVGTRAGEARWMFQVPFVRRGAVATAFVELAGPPGALHAMLLPSHVKAPVPSLIEVRAWVPLEADGMVWCELRVQDGLAKGKLRVVGADEAGSVAAEAKAWIVRELRRAGTELSSLVEEAPDDEGAGAGRSTGPERDQVMPTVGLDFRI